MKENYEAWNGYAKEYNTMARFNTKLIHLGLGLKGIESNSIVKENDKVLDVGCGNGLNTYLIAQNTSGYVLGIDVAKSAIDDANTKYGLSNLSFTVNDFENFASKYNGEVFNLVTFFGSIDYIRLNDEFFYKLNSITTKGTKCFISKFHPFWTTLYDNDIEIECNKCYFDDGREDKIQYGIQQKHFFLRYHYTLSFLVKIFKKHGWRLSLLDEPKPDIKNADFAYKNYDTDDVLMDRIQRIPMTMIIEFERGE
ncbi:methyltransferase domain-containing protein [Clostridium sp. 19966]|uniref:class I SAM-dependent methyltransferase n=1 Tax=Clostridium sp. 19966 TaxID=2768166 RepID=UPI0028DFCDFA|nr:methyltransferase domain-containing protein [Clostridium sp. 19966]MDT8716076.1 methyltransferase domain-containing protein [Clostridium sp. 19966]